MNVVVVGTGSFGRRRGADLARRGFAVAFVSRDLERARSATAAIQGPVERAAVRLEDALAWANAVVVATPPALHSEAVLVAARAGRAVLLEKPVESTLARGEALATRLGASSNCVTVAENYAFLPALGRLSGAAQGRSALRRLTRVGVRLERTRAPSGWRADAPLAGGGPGMDIGVHAVSFLRALLGELRVERASVGADVAPGIEGSLHASGASEAGIPWTLGVSWAAERRRSEVRVEGARGVLRFRPGKRWLWRLSNRWSLPLGLSRLGPDALGHEALIDDWCAAAARGSAGRVSLGSGLADLALIHAAYQLGQGGP